MSGNCQDKPRRMATSKLIALGVLLMDAVATLAVLAWLVQGGLDCDGP